jgi:carbon storage regulator
MLVLTRRLDESIVIEGGIRITVLGVKGGQVRLGISAPPDVRVDRQEVHERIASFDEPSRLTTVLSKKPDDLLLVLPAQRGTIR